MLNCGYYSHHVLKKHLFHTWKSNPLDLIKLREKTKPNLSNRQLTLTAAKISRTSQVQKTGTTLHSHTLGNEGLFHWFISVNVWLCTTHSRGSQWVYVTLRTWLRTVLYVLLLLHATSSLYECYILELLTVLCYRFMRVFLFIHTLDYMFFVVNLFFSREANDFIE